MAEKERRHIFACLGDSITSEQVTGIGTLVCERLGMKLLGNFACGWATGSDWHQGGKTLTIPSVEEQPNRFEPDNTLSSQVLRLLRTSEETGKKPDVIYIAISANDGARDEKPESPVPLLDDMELVRRQKFEELTGRSLGSALRRAVETLQRTFPQAEIFASSPLQAYSPDYEEGAFSEQALLTKREIIRKVCDCCKIVFIDAYYESGFTRQVAEKHGQIHPDQEWAGRIADYVAEKITERIDTVEYGYNSRYLYQNGKPMIPVMGEFHFSRYPEDEWKTEIAKMKAGGIGIVATYIIWIHHEEKEGEWNFEGSRNLRKFLCVCRDEGMDVWLRPGPWVHGECRNGGFPDWLMEKERKGMKLRANDPGYLKAVRCFWKKIAEEASGMWQNTGGPILGIQLENEYGHCGGPSDRKEGMEHLATLKRMAIELGFNVPYYTATGWGGAYVLEGETLPVLGGYVDAPWAGHNREMPASENFLFLPCHSDPVIGADWKKKDSQNRLHTYDTDQYPYLTAELGAGLQVTKLRRTYPWPEDIEAQTVCALGSGANLIGYYMYHGGVNPDGKYSTLQESVATGYPNDLPVKSYDFQTCIRETGEIGESYGRLKKYHLVLQDFAGLLAPAEPYFPDRRPESPEDLDTPRICVRHNREYGGGFVFLNNHQRKRKMPEKKQVCMNVERNGLSIHTFPVTMGMDECRIIPYSLPMELPEGRGYTRLMETNASLLCRLGSRYFFYADREPVYHFDGPPADLVTLTRWEADHAYRIREALYITSGVLIEEKEGPVLITGEEKNRIVKYPQHGDKQEMLITAGQFSSSVAWKQLPSEAKAGYLVWKLNLAEAMEELSKREWEDVILKIDFGGDKAELLQDRKLVADWFSNGEEWHIALKRLGMPVELELRIYPFDKEVYYDLPPKKGQQINGIRVETLCRIELPETF